MPEQFDLHHHEVQEIMGRMPSWVTRWACTGMLVIFLLIGFTANLVTFPDQVPVTVVVTRPPAGAPRIRVKVALEQAAAIRPGQPVLIDLQAYPARLYGYLPATVSQVLPFTSANVVEVRVALSPSGWRTSTGQLINYQPLLKGSGVVTVSETSLLRRIFRH